MGNGQEKKKMPPYLHYQKILQNPLVTCSSSAPWSHLEMIYTPFCTDLFMYEHTPCIPKPHQIFPIQNTSTSLYLLFTEHISYISHHPDTLLCIPCGISMALFKSIAQRRIPNRYLIEE